jgi:hypothetical protein
MTRLTISTPVSGQNYSMISDFFLPVAGGIEIAIYSLAAALLERGHKVCRAVIRIHTIRHTQI